MKTKIIIILGMLSLRSICPAELIESKRFLFSAESPTVLKMNVAQHAHGEYGSFLGIDEKTGLGYAIVVVKNNVLRDLFKEHPDAISESLDANLKSYLGGLKVIPGSLKQNPGVTLGEKSISYSFSSTGVRTTGQRAFHSGVLLFHYNAFYTIEIHSTDEAEKSAKALSSLLSSLKLLAPE